MPHYIFMLMPLAALFTAPYLRLVLSFRKGIKFYYPLQMALGTLIILALVILNYYFFQPPYIAVHIIGPILLVLLIVAMTRKFTTRGIKTFYITALFSLVLNFFMNYDFFPNLMKYQGGNELAAQMKRLTTI